MHPRQRARRLPVPHSAVDIRRTPAQIDPAPRHDAQIQEVVFCDWRRQLPIHPTPPHPPARPRRTRRGGAGALTLPGVRRGAAGGGSVVYHITT